MLASARSAASEALATLPHSRVARVALAGGSSSIFKIAGAAEFADSARREIVVNADVLGVLPVPAAPRLLGSDAETECPWLLMEDVSPAYRPIPQVPPRKAEIERMIVALARVHAQSSKLDLASAFARVEGRRHVADDQDQIPAVLDEFLASGFDDVYPESVYVLVRQLRDSVPALSEAIRAEAPVLLHGDAHHQNALHGASDAMLIDWSQATTGPGEVDLGSTLAMNLPRLIGRAREADALELYANTLREHGVATSLEAVRERYRRCLLLTVIVAIAFRAVPGIVHPTWSYLFTNAVSAAIELESGALL